MILLNRVTKIYPGDEVPALDGVTLHIQPREFVFLVGKSGAGKSTLMKMLTLEEKPTQGKILVGGIDYDYLKRRHIPHLRRRLGVVFQDFKLLPNRTVYENVAFALEIAGASGREIRRTVPTVLELVGLIDKGHKFPSDLSGGERQRVAIARSVARQPKILIADEPTGNLDPETSWGIVRLLEEINNFGTTILVTTHNEEVVNTLQRRVVTLKDGKIIGDQKESGHYDLEVPAAQPVMKVPGHGAMERMRRMGDRVRVVPKVEGDVGSGPMARLKKDIKAESVRSVAERANHDQARPKDINEESARPVVRGVTVVGAKKPVAVNKKDILKKPSSVKKGMRSL